MRLRRSFLALGLISSLGLSGCFLFPEAPTPQIPLDAREQRAVVACQKRISKEVATFQRKALKELDRCAVASLDLQLERERRLNSSNIGEFAERRQQQVEKCDAGFTRIGVASAKMIDGVAAGCAEVEPLVLKRPERGDPLGWKTIEAFIEDLLDREVIDTMTHVAGGICEETIDHLEELLLFSVGRTSDVIRKNYGLSGTEFSERLRSFLDPRCDLDTDA